ncbi:hypothetical protein QBC37DRAFT_424361 [Rhypophila decipiens]|uniref:Clr5 domain-containing protein n=1 Tax=Rhypophila decipiens TaxID=261697 RepID=A0AAN7B7B9_9PEZI|nr:hypothetical protein QBC37DRAFT_424361 [Rhypophila decipiens]
MCIHTCTHQVPTRSYHAVMSKADLSEWLTDMHRISHAPQYCWINLGRLRTIGHFSLRPSFTTSLLTTAFKSLEPPQILLLTQVLCPGLDFTLTANPMPQWNSDPTYPSGLGSAPGRYGSNPHPPNPPSAGSDWQGRQLPAVTAVTTFNPAPVFHNITLGGSLEPFPLPPPHPQPGGTSHRNEFVRPGIHASAGTHTIPENVRLGPLANTNSGRVGSNDRDPDIGPARQLPSRKPRARQPGEAQWQKNKALIEKLYMKDDLPLPEVVQIMERDHNFSATEKMYKNKFKVWHWSKHLTQLQARYISKKIKQRREQRPQVATVIEWNHQQWSEDKVMQIFGRIAHAQPQTSQPSVAHAQQQTAGQDSYAATPNEMRDIKIYTPRETAQTPREIAQTPRDVSIAQPEYRERQQNPTIPRRFYLDCPPVNLDMRRTTISDLRKLLVSASQAASSGNQEEADADFCDAVAGFRQLLSPTHEETIKAGYLYASFYANSGKMDEADAVLSWMTEKHREKWGSEDERIYLHYARMIELLRSWGLKEQAENLVYKLIEGLEDNDDDVTLSLNDISEKQIRRFLENPADLAETFPDTDDADAIRHQLNKIDLAVMANITGLEGILQTIIRHCDEDDPDELAFQACRAKCALAHRYLCGGQASDAIRVLKSGRTSLARLLEVSEEPVAYSTLGVARRLALAFFEAKDETSCNGVVDDVIMALEARLSLPECRDDILEKHALLDFVISTAFHFHEKSAFDNCRYWIERALNLAMKRFGRKSREALKLQKTLQKKDFNMRAPDGLTELLGFSRSRCVEFPAERSLLFLPRS